MPLGSPTTPATSIAPSMSGPPTSSGTPDPHLTAQVEQQAKQIEEQEAMIKTLNKQLMHCEGDLQVHMDLVTKLEGSLGEEEKNCKYRFSCVSASAAAACFHVCVLCLPTIDA